MELSPTRGTELLMHPGPDLLSVPWLVHSYLPRLQKPPAEGQTGYIIRTLPLAQHGEQGPQAILGSIPQHP